VKILHINNIANVAHTLATAQRAFGHEVTVMAPEIDTRKRGFPAPDVDLRTAHGTMYPYSWMRFMNGALPFINRFDVVHIHGGIRWWQAGLYDRIKLPRIVHMHGSETRKGFGLHHLHTLPSCILYSTPDLSPLLPNDAIWFPNPVSVPNGYYRHGSSPFSVLHVAADPTIKGTAIISKAAETLRPWCPFIVLKNVRRDRFLNELQHSDLFIDQLNGFGIYGVASVEAMLLGSVPMGSVNFGLYDPKPPIFQVSSQQDIVWMVQQLMDRPQLMEEYVRMGLRYAQQVHDPEQLAKRSINIYSNVGVRRAEGRL
jgi:glycosyltransferase involved in cell wall biosynthesis